MVKIVVEQIKCELPAQSSGGRFTIWATDVPKYGTQKLRLCTADHWALSSCGVDSFFNFGYCFNDDDIVEAFVKHFTAPSFKWKTDNWQTHEYIFALASSQVVGFDGDVNDPKTWIGACAKLCRHPKVKMIDRFENKAHGPNEMFLFRLSRTKDFKKELV